MPADFRLAVRTLGALTACAGRGDQVERVPGLASYSSGFIMLLLLFLRQRDERNLSRERRLARAGHRRLNKRSD